MWYRPQLNPRSLEAVTLPVVSYIADPYCGNAGTLYSSVVLPRKEHTAMHDKNLHIPMDQFNGKGKSCYSDYEELAFSDPTQPWLRWLFTSIQDVGKAFARDCQGYQITTDEQRQAFMDTAFYNAVHLLSSYYEADGDMDTSRVNDVVEAVCYTMSTLMSNDYIVRSSIDWSDPMAYEKYLDSNKEV